MTKKLFVHQRLDNAIPFRTKRKFRRLVKEYRTYWVYPSKYPPREPKYFRLMERVSDIELWINTYHPKNICENFKEREDEHD